MRNKIILSIIIFIYLITIGFGQEKYSKQSIPLLKSAYVHVYYFYGNQRCYSCKTMERVITEVVSANFKKENKKGLLIFAPINVEEKNNRHFIQDYKLSFKSVVLSLMQDNKEKEFKNCAEGWQYLSNEQKLKEYLIREIQTYLNKLEKK